MSSMNDAFDMNVVRQLRELDEPGAPLSFFDELAGLYFDSLPEIVAQLQAGIKNLDYGEIERASHRLKGSSANIGATRVTETSTRLMAAARSKAELPYQSEFDVLNRELEVLRDAWKAMPK